MGKTIKKNNKVKKRSRTFKKRDFQSGDGMLTSVWGPSLWHYLHTLSFNYPWKPTHEQKKAYKAQILLLEKTLPCKYCRINLKNSAEYFEWLLDRRSFLSGELFSLADIAYACSLSSLDYLGEVDWIKFPLTKKWYALIKSRPSFRDILNENIYGIPASSHYKNLDF